MDRVFAAQVLVETVARGSISAAAEHLQISRAMASRYIAAMEEWAQARLLHRTTRKLSLTAAGEQIVPVCKEFLALSQEVALAASFLDGTPKGLLRVTASSIFAEYCLADTLVAFLSEFPAMSIDLQVIDRTVNLAEDAIDLAIRITNSPDPQLIARKLGECSSVLCASRAYLDAHGIPVQIQDLAAHNCLTYAYFGQSIWRFNAGGEESAVAVQGNFSTNEALVLMRAASGGAGIAMLPRFAVSKALDEGRLVEVLPDFEAERLSIYAVYLSRHRMPPSLRVLIDFLSANLKC
ncbi:LysR family transcriptional regulator [Pseudomonas sp. B21-056]|jgi:DNA-binding transcriptional LysR family regulator|uniref:LysR family transcriptional regulator n=1 Tax=Pseudomonas sp. B21-056 TaxID=2895495 RepID=UPI00222FB6BC|nr:LysR family transcriptional regulator [Pseudomonas sp. B21-056]UZE25985.1 LysR family transcriptional regulator [Pseudomonas sp. B21-056]